MFGDLSYTSKDITSIRNEIIDFIKENNPDWEDFNESSIQMQYTEMLAGVADMLCYYLDSQALETFLTTARQRKNISSILRMMNYNFETVGASQGSVVFTRTPSEEGPDGKPMYLTDRYYIPKYLRLWTNNNLNFLTSEETSMPGDKISISVPIIQGTLMEKAFPVDTVKQSFKLQVTDTPVPLEFVEIENEGFEKVEDAFVVTTGGPYYSVHNDSYDNVYILFTYDWKNYLPSEGDIVVRYVYTEGKDGNADPNTIIHYEDGIRMLDNEGTTEGVSLTVTNPTYTYGGFSDIDINKHQANAMNWLLCHDTIVLLKDFETMVRKESWVKDCACFDWRKDDTIVSYPYQLKAWVVSIEGPTVDQKELRALTQKLQAKTVIMNTVEILNAEYVDLSLFVTISLAGSNESSRESVRQSVESRLKSWYGWDNYIRTDPDSRLQFGLSIPVTKLIYDIAGISSTITNVNVSLQEDLNLSKTEFLYCNFIRVEIES